MARPVRVQFPGAVYHISARGNHQENIYFSDQDRKLFMEIFSDVSQRVNWICHAYCLMTNHYHMLLETPDGILSRGMSLLNGLYTQKINRKYGLSGHLFQGRFHSKPVDDNAHFLAAARYIIRNPIDANMVKMAGQWPWSSYKATIGECRAPDFLMVDQVLSCLSTDRKNAVRLFRGFVHIEDDEKAMWLIAARKAKLFSEGRGKRLQPSVDLKRSIQPLPRKQKILCRPSLANLFEDVGYYDLELRNKRIVQAYQNHCYTQSEIGRHLNLNRATISRITKKLTK